MVLGVPVSELLLLATLIIIAGFITGILAGLFGIGGGALIVPVLYEVFGVLHVPDEVRFQLCVGTSIAIIVPTNLLSYLTHPGKAPLMTHMLRAWRARVARPARLPRPRPPPRCSSSPSW